MGTFYLFLADGFEEIEALCVVDILRRAELNVKTVSIKENSSVLGAHNVPVHADELFSEQNFEDAQMLILPGGLSGASKLEAHKGLRRLLLEFARDGKYLAAISTAPYTLGKLNILNGKKVTCYPGCENDLVGARKSCHAVVSDGSIITGNGPGAVFDFAFTIVEHFCGKQMVRELKKGMMIPE